MKSRAGFLAVFLSVAFIMKALGEFVHEVLGHRFFVLLFGGRITHVHTSLLWPYALSSIGYAPPQGGFQDWQTRWIAGGSIVVCLLVTSVLQTLLFFRLVRDRRVTAPLFWLSFWTFLNPTGYLILGGVKPFGDVGQLIEEGVLTHGSSIVVGLILFLVAFVSLSKIFTDLLFTTGTLGSIEDLRVFLSLLWLIIPLTTGMALTGLSFLSSMFYIAVPISFIPSILAYFLPSIQRMSLNRD